MLTREGFLGHKMLGTGYTENTGSYKTKISLGFLGVKMDDSRKNPGKK